MKFRPVGAFVLVLACAASLAACGSGSDSSGEGSKTLHVAIAEVAVVDVFDLNLSGFKQALTEAGYDVKYDVKNAQGDLGNAAVIARQIVASKPDLIYALGTPMVTALAKETTTIPIIFGLMTDPVGNNVAESPEHPGLNLTGTSDYIDPTVFLKYLTELNPSARTVGIIGDPGQSNSASYFKTFKSAAEAQGLSVNELAVSTTSDILPAVRSQKGKIDGLILPTDNTVYSALKTALRAANDADIPAIAATSGATDQGAVISLGIDWKAGGVLAGNQAVEILKGTDPGSIPVAYLAKDESALEVGVNDQEIARLGLHSIGG